MPKSLDRVAGRAIICQAEPVIPFRSRDISGQMILLGTGTSVGVPTLGCGCAVCLSADPRNKRLRCGLAVGLPGGVLLVDTPPDLRSQMLRESLGVAHAVVYTHEHADHVMGLDDVRLFPFSIGKPIPLYCEEVVEQRIRRAFDYAFTDLEPTHAGAVPQLEFHRISTEPFEVLGAVVLPIRLNHGPRFRVLGFRFGNVAYCTDTNGLPDESWERLQGLEVLVLDALRPSPHITHFSLPEAIAVAERVGARQTYFTHLSHDLDYAETCAMLPARMSLAYDGLRIPLV